MHHHMEPPEGLALIRFPKGVARVGKNRRGIIPALVAGAAELGRGFEIVKIPGGYCCPKLGLSGAKTDTSDRYIGRAVKIEFKGYADPLSRWALSSLGDFATI